MRNPALVSNQSMTARTWSPRRRRYLPRKATIFRFSTTAVFAIAIAAIAFAVDVPNVSSITAAVAFVLFTIIFAVLDRSYRRGKKRVDRAEFVRMGRWISATLRRSVLWLGFVVPRPNSSRSVAFRIVVWVLVVPTLLGIFVYLFLAYGIHTDARWPVTSPDEVAANEARRASIVRGGVYTALTAAFLTAGLAEEVIFRSVVLAEQRRASSTWISVSVVAALALAAFVLSHLEFGQGNLVTALVMGVVCTAIALYTRSLWPAIVVHGVYDAIIMVDMALSV